MTNSNTFNNIQNNSNSINEAVSKRNQQRAKNKKDIYQFDRLKMYLGWKYEIPISDEYAEYFKTHLTIYVPTIGDIVNYGEEKFMTNILNPLISHTTQYRLPLWQSGIDWNEISDFELFLIFQKRQFDYEGTKLFFGDINLNDFECYVKELTEEEIKENEDRKGEKDYIPHKPKNFLIHTSRDIIIDEKTYETMAEYIRTMFNMFPKVQKARGRGTKQALIDEDMYDYDNKNKDKSDSVLLPLISACVNHPGFKYKTSELVDVNIVQFMDSVKRLQIYESTKALNNGRFSGFCDLSNVDQELFNFMRDIKKS